MVKQRIRLTESQLHNIIRRCVNEARKGRLNESHGEPEQYPCVLIDNILEDYEAAEIAEDLGFESADEAAMHYFSETMYESEEKEAMIPKYHEYVASIDEEHDLYRDYGAEYYFVVVKRMAEGKKRPTANRLNESIRRAVHRFVNEAVNEISPELAHKAANAAMERSVQNGDKRQMQSQKFANYAAQGAVRRNGMMNGNGMDNNTMSVNPTYNQHYKTYTYGSNTGTGDSQTMANTRADLQNLGQSDYGNQKKQQERNAYQQKIANLKRMYGQDWQEHLYDER